MTTSDIILCASPFFAGFIFMITAFVFFGPRR